MTEKHYLAWVKTRQKQLSASVRRAWFAEVKQPPVQPVPGNSPAGKVLDITIAECNSLKLHNWMAARITYPWLYV
jgi:desulfoferrodoxin (superoxide reductase-like protein)